MDDMFIFYFSVCVWLCGGACAALVWAIMHCCTEVEPVEPAQPADDGSATPPWRTTKARMSGAEDVPCLRTPQSQPTWWGIGASWSLVLTRVRRRLAGTLYNVHCGLGCGSSTTTHSTCATEVFYLLLAHGADMNAGGQAARGGLPVLYVVVLAGADASYGRRHSLSWRFITRMVEEGVDVNAVDQQCGRTVLDGPLSTGVTRPHPQDIPLCVYLYAHGARCRLPANADAQARLATRADMKTAIRDAAWARRSQALAHHQVAWADRRGGFDPFRSRSSAESQH